MDLKFRGYRAEHREQVLPVDTLDHLATHILFCETTPAGPIPVATYRFVSLEIVQAYRQEFPAITIARTSGATEHEAAIAKILADSAQRNVALAYSNFFTISPDTRGQKSKVQLIRDLVIATHALYQERYSIQETLACGVVRFKIPDFERQMGYEPLTYRGKTLPPIQQHSLWGEPVVMMHQQGPSSKAKELAERYRALWENALILEPETQEPSEIQAA